MTPKILGNAPHFFSVMEAPGMFVFFRRPPPPIENPSRILQDTDARGPLARVSAQEVGSRPVGEPTLSPLGFPNSFLSHLGPPAGCPSTLLLFWGRLPLLKIDHRKKKRYPSSTLYYWRT